METIEEFETFVRDRVVALHMKGDHTVTHERFKLLNCFHVITSSY